MRCVYYGVVRFDEMHFFMVMLGKGPRSVKVTMMW